MLGQDVDTRAGQGFLKSLKRLRQESAALKARIDRERRAHDLPVDPTPGIPEREAEAADRRFDATKDDE